MVSYKVFLISIIVFSFVIQLGNLVLNKTKFEEIFKSVSGVIVVVLIISTVSSCDFNVNKAKTNSNFNNDQINKENEKNVISQFQNNLKTIIEKDLHKKYYVNLNVEVQTDLKTLKIIIKGPFGEWGNEIKTYVTNKYCTPHDEVILIGEGT